MQGTLLVVVVVVLAQPDKRLQENLLPVMVAMVQLLLLLGLL
jgi:hypothetical protein